MENNSSLKSKENNQNNFFLFSEKKPLANTENTKNKNHPLSQTHFQCFLFSRTENSSWKQQPNRPLCFLCSPLYLLLLLPPSFMVTTLKMFHMSWNFERKFGGMRSPWTGRRMGGKKRSDYSPIRGTNNKGIPYWDHATKRRHALHPFKSIFTAHRKNENWQETRGCGKYALFLGESKVKEKLE